MGSATTVYDAWRQMRAYSGKNELLRAAIVDLAGQTEAEREPLLRLLLDLANDIPFLGIITALEFMLAVSITERHAARRRPARRTTDRFDANYARSDRPRTA